MTAPLVMAACGHKVRAVSMVDKFGRPCELCPSCEMRDLQIEIAEGQRQGREQAENAQAEVAVAKSEELGKVIAVITEVRPGAVFSANHIRDRFGFTGPVVGAAFTAARKAGLIKAVGYEPSSDPKTHGHPIRTWQRRTAA